MLLLAPQNKVRPDPLQVKRSLSYGLRILPISLHAVLKLQEENAKQRYLMGLI